MRLCVLVFWYFDKFHSKYNDSEKQEKAAKDKFAYSTYFVIGVTASVP